MKQSFEDAGCQTMQDSHPCEVENQRGKPSDRLSLLPWESFKVTAEDRETDVEPSSLPVSRTWSWESGESKVAGVHRTETREGSAAEGLPWVVRAQVSTHVWGNDQRPVKGSSEGWEGIVPDVHRGSIACYYCPDWETLLIPRVLGLSFICNALKGKVTVYFKSYSQQESVSTTKVNQCIEWEEIFRNHIYMIRVSYPQYRKNYNLPTKRQMIQFKIGKGTMIEIKIKSPWLA